MKAQSEPDSHQHFDHDRHGEHGPSHANHIAQALYVRFGLRRESHRQPQGVTDQQAEQGGGRHHAETADLNEYQDHSLAKG